MLVALAGWMNQMPLKTGDLLEAPPPESVKSFFQAIRPAATPAKSPITKSSFG